MRALLLVVGLLVPGVARAQTAPDTLWLRSGTRVMGALRVEMGPQGEPARIGTSGGETFSVDYVVGFDAAARYARVVPALRRGRAGYVVVERVTTGPLALFAPWGGMVGAATYFATPDGTLHALTPEHLAPFADGPLAARRVAQARAGQRWGQALVFVGGLALAAGTALAVLESDVQGRSTIPPLAAALGVSGAGAVGTGLVWRWSVRPQLRLAAQGL